MPARRSVLGLLALLTLLVPACMSGPSVQGHWDSSQCINDFTWWDEVHVRILQGQQVVAGASYDCADDPEFDLDVPGGATDLDVLIQVTHHQDQTGTDPPVHYGVPGPVDGPVDLGLVQLH